MEVIKYKLKYYSFAPETSLVLALKDSVKGMETTSASTGTPGVSEY